MTSVSTESYAALKVDILLTVYYIRGKYGIATDKVNFSSVKI